MADDTDSIVAFIAAMEAAGVRPVDPIAQRLGPELIRFRCEGDRTKANGWAVLHLDGRPAGAFGNYRLGISERWSSGVREVLSPAARRERAQAFEQERAKREAERLARQRAAAAACAARWEAAGPVDPRHPYLRAKGITGEGLRQSGGWLLVPMRDAMGQIWNVQSIGPDGAKRFAKGGRQDGLYCLTGTPDAVICIGEGYGTCAAVRRATGHCVAVAFSAANLTATAQALRGLHPDADLILLADDDPHLVDNPRIRKNVGLEAARAAAVSVGGKVAMPPQKMEAA